MADHVDAAGGDEPRGDPGPLGARAVAAGAAGVLAAEDVEAADPEGRGLGHPRPPRHLLATLLLLLLARGGLAGREALGLQLALLGHDGLRSACAGRRRPRGGSPAPGSASRPWTPRRTACPAPPLPSEPAGSPGPRVGAASGGRTLRRGVRADLRGDLLGRLPSGVLGRQGGGGIRGGRRSSPAHSTRPGTRARPSTSTRPRAVARTRHEGRETFLAEPVSGRVARRAPRWLDIETHPSALGQGTPAIWRPAVHQGNASPRPPDPPRNPAPTGPGRTPVAGVPRPVTGSLARVSTAPSRVYAARLVGLPIFDPQGDQVGKVRDLVVALRSEVEPAAGARAGRRGLRPAPDLRADDPGHQHRQRAGLHHRPAQHAPLRAAPHRDPRDRRRCSTARCRDRATGVRGTVYDVAMEQARNRDWVLSRVAVQEPAKGFRRRGPDPRRGVARRRGPRPAPGGRQGATHLIAALNDMRPADAANVIHDLPAERRTAVVGRARRRAARRRPRGAPRGGPGRDPRAPRLRARRGRARGDVRRRRRRPDRRPAAGDRRDAAGADGARRGRGRPAADVVRRADRRRDDDARAGDPRPRRDHRRRARPRAQPRPHRRRWPRWSTSAASRWRPPTGRLLGVAHIQRLLREPPSTLVAGGARQLDGPAAPARPASRRSRPTSRRTTWWPRPWSTTTAGCSAR